MMMKTILRYCFHLVTLVALLLLGWVWLKYDQNVEAARTITRLTARMSMIIFLFVFSASSWHRISPGEWSATLLKNRRRLGLTFAYSHTIHLVCIVTYFLLVGSRPALSTLVVGGGAYVAMYLMAVTSNDRSVSKLGARNWKRIHRIGIYYLWAVFFLTYLTRSLALRPVDGASKVASVAIDIAGMILLLGVMVLRLSTMTRSRARSAAAVA
jgi:methionine sulfoxide reductase heme-binding subunit